MPCTAPCVSSSASRDPYQVLFQFGGGTPPIRTCCYHPDAVVRVSVVDRRTRVSGDWEEDSFVGEGPLGGDVSGTHTHREVTISPPGDTTETDPVTFTVGRDFSVDFPSGVPLQPSRDNGAQKVFNAVGGDNGGSGATGCAGYTAHYWSALTPEQLALAAPEALARWEVWVTIEIIDVGGVCCDDAEDGGGGSPMVPSALPYKGSLPAMSGGIPDVYFFD